MPNPTNLRRRSWVKTRARGAKWFLLIASLRHTTLIVIIFTDYASNKMRFVCYTILCITLCITNHDFRVFCVTERASVTSVSRNEKADNRLIISFLLGAENETRTRDPNLGKVVLYQLSYFRISGISECKYKRFFLFLKIFTRKFTGQKSKNCHTNLQNRIFNTRSGYPTAENYSSSRSHPPPNAL